tara:strand:- start:6215 stop:6961 length:747 start_codon:yes stop_codon:yes gene_type:complete
VCEPTAIVTGVSGGLSALSGARAAAGRNKAAMANYQLQLEQRKQNWNQQLSIWGAKRVQYKRNLDENDLAAQRGYTRSQQAFNNKIGQAFQRNEALLTKYLAQSGQLEASGRTGKSIRRTKTLDLAALQRSYSKTFYSLSQSEEAYKQSLKDIEQAQRSHRNQLHSKVSRQPIPDFAPPPPVLEDESPFTGLLSAGLSAAGQSGAFNNLFTKDNTLQTVGDTFKDYTSDPFSTNYNMPGDWNSSKYYN